MRHYVQFEKCSYEIFGYKDKYQYNNSQIPNFNCISPGQVQLVFNGDYYSKNFTYLELTMQRCDNATFNNSCKSKDEIEAFMLNARVTIIMINSYFDFRDFEG